MGRKVLGGAQGRHGRLFIGEQEYCVTSWNVTETADEEDTTNSCSAGNAEQEYGITQLEGSVELDWDVAASPYRTPAGIGAGSKHALSYLFIHAPGGIAQDLASLIAGGTPYYKATFHINNIAVTNPARGKCTVGFDIKSSGSYSLPTQSLSSGA